MPVAFFRIGEILPRGSTYLDYAIFGSFIEKVNEDLSQLRSLKNHSLTFDLM